MIFCRGKVSGTSPRFAPFFSWSMKNKEAGLHNKRMFKQDVAHKPFLSFSGQMECSIHP